MRGTGELSPAEIEEYRHLWDGSENWELHAFHYSQSELEIVFEGARPTPREILALRKLLYEYGNLPMQELKASIGDLPRLKIGNYRNSRAQKLQVEAQRLGLSIYATDTSRTGYLPIFTGKSDITGLSVSEALVIENNELAERVTKRMRAAGVPVTESYQIE